MKCDCPKVLLLTFALTKMSDFLTGYFLDVTKRRKLKHRIILTSLEIKTSKIQTKNSKLQIDIQKKM